MMQVHHAVVFEGDRAPGLIEAFRYLEETLQMPVHANPDVSVLEFEKWGIDDVRALKERAAQCPFGLTQAFVVAADRIPHAAQNALLKLLEEPASDTHFVLVVPTLRMLLPTVRSRVAVGGHVANMPTETALAATFLKTTPGERQKIIDPIIKNKERVKARELLNAMESLLYRADLSAQASALEEIAFVRQYVTDDSSSLKFLLAHLAVTLPRTDVTHS